MMTAGMLLFTKIAASGSAILYVIVPGSAGRRRESECRSCPRRSPPPRGPSRGRPGLASGLVNTSRQVGGGLGLAVLITLATSLSSHLIGQGHGVLQSLTDGFRLGYFIGAGLCAAAALVTFDARATSGTGSAGPLAAPGPRRKRGGPRPDRVGVSGVSSRSSRSTFAFGGSHGAPIGAYATDNTYSYVGQPALRPPVIRADTPTDTSKLAPGYIFMTNFYDLNHPPMMGQSGPLILDNHLQPVWFRPVPTNVVAGNLSLQVYNGKPVLAWWQGMVTSTGVDRERRVRDRRPALPDDRDAEGHRRLGPDAARDRDPRSRRVGDREQEHPDGPVAIRRRLQRRAGSTRPCRSTT